MHNDIWEQKLFTLLIVRGRKYRRRGENIVTIFSPQGEDIVGVKILFHTGIALYFEIHTYFIVNNQTTPHAAAGESILSTGLIVTDQPLYSSSIMPPSTAAAISFNNNLRHQSELTDGQ